MTSQNDDYVLGRDLYGSVRLDTQHLLWKMINGYTMNPKIPVDPGIKIAEMGTGTGMWLLDLATQLPQTVQMDGYDLSDSQFPHKSFLPTNVSLNILDAFGDVPADLVGKYDVVHLRFWSCIVKGNDPSRLVQPGGYMQWEEGHLGQNIIRGDVAEKFGSMVGSILSRLDIEFDWITNIQANVSQDGFTILEGESRVLPLHLVPLITKTYLAGWSELFKSINKLDDPSIPSDTDRHKLLWELATQTKNGAMFHWTPVTLLAQKSLA
ncbi:hypothetical protein N7490_011958 [Penicillium lividum]|nr:hypothetical protein N7490_011958 [Penicillium lividum]